MDVFLWLEDSASKQVVYPDGPSAKGWHGMGAYPASAGKKQWLEWEIRADLSRGVTYEVCLSVGPQGSGAGPNIQSTNVGGSQVHFEY